MKNINIIHLVLGKANPQRMNGVNRVVHQLANTQATLGQSVTIWGIANDLIANYPERNCQTILFQQYKNKTLCPQLRKAINNLTTSDVVHIHGAFILEFYQVARLLHQKQIPYVFTPHGAYAKAAMQKNKWVKKVYFQLLEKYLIKNAKAVQLLGEGEYNHLGEMTNLGVRKMIPNGMDFRQIPTNLDFSPIKDRTLTFGFLGRLDTYHKGLDLMLKGFKKYLDIGGRGKLELIGDGADRPTLEKLAIDLGIIDHVTFHGALFGLKKFHTLHQFDVFLHTSRMEGFPMAVLEAAALAIPSVTSEATNINSYIRNYNAGIPLPNNTSNSIASIMSVCEDLYQQNQLDYLGKNAKEMVSEAFDWKKIAQDLYQTYAA